MTAYQSILYRIPLHTSIPPDDVTVVIADDDGGLLPQLTDLMEQEY